MSGVKAGVGIRVQNTGCWYPSVEDWGELLPLLPRALTATNQYVSPQSIDAMLEEAQLIDVAGYSMVLVVAGNHTPKPYADLRQSQIWERICRAEPDLKCDGLRIFVERVDKDGWVPFQKESDTEEAKRYVRLLYELGFNRDSEIVARSGCAEEWKARLGYQGADLQWNYVKVRDKKSLSIRPCLDGAGDPTHAGFRFALVMGYILFGRHAA